MIDINNQVRTNSNNNKFEPTKYVFTDMHIFDFLQTKWNSKPAYSLLLRPASSSLVSA